MTSVHCPKCGCAFEMSSLMHEHLEAELKVRLQSELEAKLAEVARVADERMRGVNDDLAAARAKLASSDAREAELLKTQRALEEREQRTALVIERRIADETRLIRERESKVAQERSERLAGERERVLALDYERRLADESRRIREGEAQVVEQRAEVERERHRLLVEEQRQKNEGLEKTIEELHRKLRQGSQQAQGEVQEVVLRDLLTEAFEFDAIDDVPKGASGADVLQGVRAPDGRECGTIVWESKRTKSWSDDWLPKLRDDQRASGAALAVIVTQALPAGVRLFTERDGVWICSWSCATALAAALRGRLIDVSLARRVTDGRGEKMQMLFEYLTGAEFRNRVSGLAEPLADMQEDLEREKRAVLALWKRRERQLGRARDNLSAFYGDIQGIAGRTVLDLPALSLGAIAALPAHPDGDDMDETGIAEDVGTPRADDPALVSILFALVPLDGANVGNGTLSERFTEQALLKLGANVSMADYERCKATLLERGRIRRGKGKGGSVARAAVAESAVYLGEEASRHN
jgi:hypothetical protein